MNTETFALNRTNRAYWDYQYVNWAQTLYGSFSSRNDTDEMVDMAHDFAERWGISVSASYRILSRKADHKIVGDFDAVEITFPLSHEIGVHRTREAAEASMDRLIDLGIATDENIRLERFGSCYIVSVAQEG